MIVVESLLLSLLLFYSFKCSLSDFKVNKIFNKELIIGFVISIIINSIYYSLFNSNEFSHYIGNIVFGIICSFILYIFNIWAGGDTKLFILLSLLVPAECYYNEGVISIVIIFVLIFSISFIYILIESVVFKCIKKKTFKSNSSIKSIRTIIYYLLFVSGNVTLIQTGIRYIIPNLYFKYRLVFMFANVFIVLYCRESFFRTNKIVRNIIILIGSICYLFSIYKGYFFENTKEIVIVLVILIFKLLAEKYNYEEIPTKNVEEGMVLSFSTVISFMNSKVKGLPLKTTEDIKSRITKQEAESIKKWANSSNGKEKIIIVRKIPFAVFISLGFISYLLIGGILWLYV